MRAWIVTSLVILAGCATSADLGVIQHPLADHLGASFDLHGGLGPVMGKTLVVEADARVDAASSNSRLALGGDVLGGLPIGTGRILARAGIWAAPISSAPEQTVVPTFMIGGFVPLDTTPKDADPNHGWHQQGIVFGVREDLDRIAYTTVFVGVQMFFILGY